MVAPLAPKNYLANTLNFLFRGAGLSFLIRIRLLSLCEEKIVFPLHYASYFTLGIHSKLETFL